MHENVFTYSYISRIRIIAILQLHCLLFIRNLQSFDNFKIKLILLLMSLWFWCEQSPAKKNTAPTEDPIFLSDVLLLMLFSGILPVIETKIRKINPTPEPVNTPKTKKKKSLYHLQSTCSCEKWWKKILKGWSQYFYI